MPLQPWIGREPISTQEVRDTFSTRRIVTARYVLAGGNLSVTYPVPQGRTYLFKHAYVQVNTSAGGATVRQALLGFWVDQMTQFGGTSTNIVAVASTAFNDNMNHLLMFAPGGDASTLGAGTYRSERINVQEEQLMPGDWVRLDVYECTAGDIVTVVLVFEESEYR